MDHSTAAAIQPAEPLTRDRIFASPLDCQRLAGVSDDLILHRYSGGPRSRDHFASAGRQVSMESPPISGLQAGSRNLFPSFRLFQQAPSAFLKQKLHNSFWQFKTLLFSSEVCRTYTGSGFALTNNRLTDSVLRIHVACAWDINT